MCKKKLLKNLLLAVFIAGFFILSAGFLRSDFPKGTMIEGVSVSGMKTSAAERLIEEKLQKELENKRLTVEVDGVKYHFSYPEISLKTDLRRTLTKAKKEGGKHILKKKWDLVGKENVIRGICDDFYRKSHSAKIHFHPDSETPFTYDAEQSGRYLSGAALSEKIDLALENGTEKVVMKSCREAAPFSIYDAKRATTLLCEFSTKYNPAVSGRSQNIRLAAKKINGTVLEVGETFSFNKTVGERTRANGFCEAPIIVDGSFVSGVGGGVCQASTTLYNAALISGLKIVEYHPHSLPVGYVEASFDAMVSGKNCDLRFTNLLGGKVYITCFAENGKITVRIYGEKSSITYRRESIVTGLIEPPAPREVEGEGISKDGKSGLTSEGYLVTYKNGVMISKIRLRKDKYLPTRGIIYKNAQTVA